jgi:hypothetical protein
MSEKGPKAPDLSPQGGYNPNTIGNTLHKYVVDFFSKPLVGLMHAHTTNDAGKVSKRFQEHDFKRELHHLNTDARIAGEPVHFVVASDHDNHSPFTGTSDFSVFDNEFQDWIKEHGYKTLLIPAIEVSAFEKATNDNDENRRVHIVAYHHDTEVVKELGDFIKKRNKSGQPFDAHELMAFGEEKGIHFHIPHIIPDDWGGTEKRFSATFSDTKRWMDLGHYFTLAGPSGRGSRRGKKKDNYGDLIKGGVNELDRRRIEHILNFRFNHIMNSVGELLQGKLAAEPDIHFSKHLRGLPAAAIYVPDASTPGIDWSKYRDMPSTVEQVVTRITDKDAIWKPADVEGRWGLLPDVFNALDATFVGVVARYKATVGEDYFLPIELVELIDKIQRNRSRKSSKKRSKTSSTA